MRTHTYSTWLVICTEIVDLPLPSQNHRSIHSHRVTLWHVGSNEVLLFIDAQVESQVPLHNMLLYTPSSLRLAATCQPLHTHPHGHTHTGSSPLLGNKSQFSK